MKLNQVIQGDCLEIMNNIEDKSIDAIITDPPYGTTACKWDAIISFDKMWKQLHRIIKFDGAIVLFGSEPFSSALRMSNIKKYKYDWYWIKDRGSNFLNARRQPLRNVENILIFNVKKYIPIMENRGGPSHSIGKSAGKINEGSTQGRRINVNGDIKTNLKYPRTALKFSVPHPPIHSTQKPVALMEYLIRTYTNEGEVVLDFTAGSGTTGVACKNLNRNFILIEKDPEYCEIARERIKKTDNKLPLAD
jgi:site-specific DNA-methyltransferase (adenine-specific)